MNKPLDLISTIGASLAAVAAVVAVTIVVGTASPTRVQAVEGNLIPNPSAETASSTTAPASWFKDGWGTGTRTYNYLSSGCQDGAKCLGVTISGYKSGDAKWEFPAINATPNTTYTFSDWYQSGVATEIDAEIVDTSGNITYVGLAQVPASASWKQHTVTYTTPANAAKITFYHILASNGTLKTDNYSLTSSATVPTPPTPTPPTPTPPVPTPPTPAPAASKVISRSVPATASSGTASSANDGNYNTVWKSTGASSWLAYNLASVPAAQRSSVLLVWYNELTESYDYRLSGESGVNFPRNYTIQTNASSSSSTPSSGWVTKATVTDNVYQSREHVIDMTGANWVRINVTSVRGSNSQLNMDVYPATEGKADGWIFYGSSTPSMAMNHQNIGNVTQSFSQMINAAKPGYFPVQENGSIGGLTTTDGVNNINTWLPLFPGRYVAIGLGANDAAECMAPATYYNNMKIMVDRVIAAGKTPVVPYFNWSPYSDACGDSLITQITNLYADYPQIVRGPDFWNYYKSHPELISSDQTHPTAQGLADFRRLWAESALANVYNQ